jgi:hypothetical protein
VKVGDLVKALHVDENLGNGKSNVGFIVKIDRSSTTRKLRYWVKLFGGWNISPFPFMERQLEVVSKSS